MKKKTKYPKDRSNNEKEEDKNEQHKTKYPKEEKKSDKNKKKKIKKEKQNKKKNNSDNEEKDEHPETETYNTIEIIEEKVQINEINDVTEKEIKDTLENIVFDEFFDEIEDNHYNKNDIVENNIEGETLEKDKIVKKQYNPYTINGELNNYLNPFINNNENFDKSEILDIDLETKKEYLTSSSSSKSESDIKLNKEKNEHDNKARSEKEIIDEEKTLLNRDYLTEYNKIFTKNNEFTGYFRNLTYKGKIFYLMTKIKNINKADILHYYCRNHDTSKSSLDGKRHSICEAKIKLDKNNNIYSLITDHSEKCRELENIQLENIHITNKEIENKEKYKEELLKYLNSNPLIILSEFNKHALNLYRGNEYKFDLKKNFIRNLYYNWKKDNIIFTKFSVFTSNKCLNGEIYMREYLSKYIYKNINSEEQIQHEHIIFMSPFQIRRMAKSKHLYFDCTFVYPKDFSQLIIILYFDDDIQKRAPGCYILINNKTENGYKMAFKSFKEIITLGNTIELSLVSYSTDFEKALYNSLEDTFPNIRRLGCFFHFSYNIRKKLKEYNIIKKENINEDNEFLKDILSIPFKIQNNENIIDDIFKKYSKDSNINKFKNYFYKQWENIIKSGILNYAYASVQQRSNSFIENYNRRIKTELCKYT